MSLRTRLVTGSLYTLFASLAGQAIAMVTTIIYARLLVREEFGVLAVYLQLGSLIVPFAVLGLNIAVTKFVAEFRRTDPEKAEQYMGVAVTLALAVGVAMTIVYFVLAGPLAAVYGRPELDLMIRLSAAFLVLNAVTTVVSAIIQGFQAIKKLAMLNLATQSLGIPLTFAFVWTLGLVGAAVAGVVFVAGAATLSLWVIRGVLREENVRLRPRWNRTVAGRMVRYSIPLLLSMVILRPAVLFQVSIVALWLSYGDLGLLRAATSLYHVALLVPVALSVPLLPALTEAYATQTEQRTRVQMTSLLRTTMFLGLPLALIIGLGSTVLIPLLYGAEYADAAILLYVLSLAAFLDTVSAIGENTLLGTGRTWNVLRLNLGQAAAIVVGSAVLVPAFGVIGATYATVLASFAYLTGAFLELAYRREFVAADVRDVSSLAVIAFGASALLVWTAGLGNYLLIAIFLAALLVAEIALLTPRDRTLLRNTLTTLVGIFRKPSR